MDNVCWKLQQGKVTYYSSSHFKGGQGCNSANITLSVINKSNVEQSHNLHLEWVHYSKRILVQIAHDSLSHRKAFHLAQRNL